MAELTHRSCGSTKTGLQVVEDESTVLEQAFYDDIEYKVRVYVRMALGQGHNRACMDDVYASIDQLIEQLNADQNPPLDVACQAGCSWCCHLKVEVTQFEVFRIAAFLIETLSEKELEDITKKVISTDFLRRSEEVSEAEHSVPCALLSDGQCTIYPARPLKCRGGNSTDADTCKAYFETGEDGLLSISAPQLLSANSVQDGLAAGTSDVCDKRERSELMAMLGEVLMNPDTIQEWVDDGPSSEGEGGDED